MSSSPCSAPAWNGLWLQRDGFVYFSLFLLLPDNSCMCMYTLDDLNWQSCAGLSFNQTSLLRHHPSVKSLKDRGMLSGATSISHTSPIATVLTRQIKRNQDSATNFQSPTLLTEMGNAYCSLLLPSSFTPRKKTQALPSLPLHCSRYARTLRKSLAQIPGKIIYP